MKNVYLIDLFNQKGEYLKTCSIAFTSKAAAQRYKEDCCDNVNAQIKQVQLISLSDY